MVMNKEQSAIKKQTLNFYTTLGCHLCEQAQALYQQVLNPAFFDINVIDIADDDELMERYGTRIPVIQQTANKRELGWPFDAQTLIEFLSEE